MITKELRMKALKLRPIDKIHLVEIVLESLDRPDPEIEKLWVDESERRYKAYREKKIKGTSLKKIQERYEK